MAILDLVVVFGLLGLLTYGILRLLEGSRGPGRPAPRAGHWRAAHYDVDGTTRIVVEKVALNGGAVLDEHLVAKIGVDDPDYDARFMTAMAAARERQALFEAEET